MRTRFTACQMVSLLTALCLMLSCGDSGTTAELDGRTFLLDSAQGFEPVAQTTLSVSFDDGMVSVHAGCNSQGGDYSVQGGRLVVSSLASTLIGCDPARSAQDDWLREFITARPRLALSGDRLTLTGDEATLVLLDRKVKDPDRALVGTLWTIDAFITGDAVSSGPSNGEPATILFAADDNVRVYTGCNAGEGHYAVNGNKITLMAVAYDERACSGVGSSEAHIEQVLSAGTLTFMIEANGLTLEHGSLGVTAKSPD